MCAFDGYQNHSGHSRSPVIPANIAINDIPLKLDSFRYISVAESFGRSSTTFT